MSLHDAQKLDYHLGRRSDEDLALATALGIDDIVQAVVLPFVSLQNSKVEEGYARVRRREP